MSQFYGQSLTISIQMTYNPPILTPSYLCFFPLEVDISQCTCRQDALIITYSIICSTGRFSQNWFVITIQELGCKSKIVSAVFSFSKL